jgi:hypothetical protein
MLLLAASSLVLIEVQMMCELGSALLFGGQLSCAD